MKDQVHLMFVDDDSDDRLLFKEAVNQVDPGKVVTLFDNGFQLLRILKTFLPDVIFLDMNMPGMSGFECLKEIRKEKAYNKIAVVMYSTSADEQTINKAYDAGANLYIKKPSSFEKIKKSIEKLLSMDAKDLFPRPTKQRFLLEA